MVQSLAPLQFFLLPATILLLLWSIWRTFIKMDKAMGLVLYIGLVIIVDEYMEALLPLSGLINVKFGSIRYSDLLILWLLLTDSYQRRSDINVGNTNRKQIIGLALVLSLLFLYAAFRTYRVDWEALQRYRSIAHGLRDYRLVILKPVLSLYIAITGFRDREDYKKFIIYLVVLGFIFFVASAELKFFDRLFLKGLTYEKSRFWLIIRRDGRIGGFFLNPNNMGNFCVMLFPIYILGFKVFKRVREKIFLFIGLLALLFAFLLTQSRGSMVGFFATLPLLLFLPVSDMKFSHKIGAALIIIIVFLSLMPGAIEKVTRRLDTLKLDRQQIIELENSRNDGISLDSRISVWKDGLKIGMKSPIFGIGLGESSFFIEAYLSRMKGTTSITLDHAHSSYLNMFIQVGIISVIIFLVMNMIVILSAFKTLIKYRNHALSPILAGCSVGIAGYCVCMISQNTLFKADAVTLYWVLLGIVCGLVGRIKYEESDAEKDTVNP